MGIECPKCHFDNPDDTVYCGKCGTPLPSSKEIPVTETLETPVEELNIGTTFAGRYQIIEELGKGGMGKVYRAFDKKLNEDVALKVIKPEIASNQRTIERFSNELKLARKISHRNVGRMYELMEEEDAHFITMEYISGEDLKSLIRRAGPLNIRKTILIAKQACEGLSEAHRLGVVHRDLKPQNVMIDKEGNAKIMDFGIARSYEAEGITETGVIIGTPQYMSPEQVEGKETDKRSDIYSLGVILFEMVTGRVPFEGDTPLSIALKTKAEAPPDPRQINDQIPEDLSRIILRCINKDKKERYQNAEDVFFDLRKLEEGIPITPTVKMGRVKKRKRYTFRAFLRDLRKRKIIHTLAAFIAGGVAAVEFVYHILVHNYNFPKYTTDITIVVIASAMICTVCWRWFRGAEKKPRRIKVELLVIPIVILITVLLGVKFFLQSGGSEWANSIAVLPVENLSQQRDQELLCNAMHDKIITKLRLLMPDLRVMSRQAILEYTNAGRNFIDVCKDFEYETILESSLWKENENIRMTVKLVNVEDGSLLGKPYTYEENTKDFFELQDEICHDIAKELNVHLQEEKIPIVKTREPTNYEAEVYYIWGNLFEKKYDDSRQEKDFEEGVRNYEEALKIDSNYALAHWGLGNIYQSRYVKDEDLKDYESMVENYQLAYDINPNLAESNLGLGWHNFFREELDKSYYFFKRAFELDPNNSSINFDLGSFFWSIGLGDQAINYYSRAIEFHPLDGDSYEMLSNCYIRMGEFDKAVDCLKKALKIDEHNFWFHTLYAESLILMKKYGEAEEKINQAEKLNPKSPYIRYYRAWVSAARGEKKKALTLIEGRASYLYEVTSIYSLLEMKDEAIENIIKGIKIGFRETQEYLYTYLVLKNNICYESLREDPRFKKIVKAEKKKYDEWSKRYGQF